MSSNLLIAFRFLTAKKRAMLMSLSCTVLGIGLFIVTQATTSGFEQFFVQTILGTEGALRVEDQIQDTMRSMGVSGGAGFQVRQKEGVKFIEGVAEPQRVIEAIDAFGGVTGASAVLQGKVQLTSWFKTEEAQVFGIRLEEYLQVSALGKQVIAGNIEDFRSSPSAAMVGSVLANRLQVVVGDSFVMKAANGESRRYHVAAIFETGYRDFDKSRVYLDITEVRSLLKKATGASFIQVRLANPERAPALADRLVDVLRHSATPWQVRQKDWLQLFAALRVSSAITVMVFTLIASLAMFNTLAMVVIEKTKDIAILRSMGYERRDITQIFLWQAGIVLAIGAALGTIFGVAVTWAVSRVPIHINTLFKTDHFIVAWDGMHLFILQAIVTAVIMVMIASLVPARRAARLEPGDIVRGTAQ